MPTAPSPILPAASGGGAPAAPAQVLAAPAGGTPAAPVVVLSVAPAGGSPTAPGGVLAANGARNFLETALAGTNNDLRFTQVGLGPAPTIQFVLLNAVGNTAGVVVTGRAMLVKILLSFGLNGTTTAATVKGWFEASSLAMALVSVAHAAGNDGSGLVCQPGDNDISFGPTDVGDGTATAPAGVLAAAPALASPGAPEAVLGAVAGGPQGSPLPVLGDITTADAPHAPRPVLEPSSGWPGLLTLGGVILTVGGEDVTLDPI